MGTSWLRAEEAFKMKTSKIVDSEQIFFFSYIYMPKVVYTEHRAGTRPLC
jgi:hypothetical protein